MKLASKQIADFLKNPLRNCLGTLIYGADEGQVREHAATIAKQVVKDVNDPFSVAELSEDTLKGDVARLSDELFAMNMLGGQRLVRVDGSSDATGKLLADIYNGDKLPDAYLLVTAGELGTRSPLRALFENHAKLAALPCYRDEAYQIDAMVQQMLREAGIGFEREVVEYLAANLGNDRRVSRSEIEKIILYCGEEKQLSIQDAMELVGNSAELTLDDLTTAIADGNVRAAERILSKQLKEGTQAVQMVRAFQRYFQRLHWLHAQVRHKGMGAEQAIGEIKPKIFFKLVPVLRKHLNLWSLPAVEAALQLLTETEQRIKETGNSAELTIGHYTIQLMALGHRYRKAG